MPVYKYLDLSTAHITQKDSHLLDVHTSSDLFRSSLHQAGMRHLIVRKHPYGMWIHVPIGAERDETIGELKRGLSLAGYSPALGQILDYAAERNCYWINLDMDADEEEDLPTYDWGASKARGAKT